VHPYHKEQFDKELIESFLTHPKCIAVGECGLDYYRLPEGKEAIEEEKRIQKEIFLEHIELSIKHRLPLIVHIREANHDSFEMLESAQKKGARGVLHCYNASELLLGLSENFYYGIGGVVTFKNARKLTEIVHKIPQDRLLLETDGPYLTPHPHRGERNEPAYTALVAKKISQILDINMPSLARLTSRNAKNLFRELQVEK